MKKKLKEMKRVRRRKRKFKSKWNTNAFCLKTQPR